jgi:hypothetical protein
MNAVLHVRSLCVAIAACLLLLAAAPAKAQQQPSANAMATAKELVDIIGASREFESIPTAVVVQTASTFLQSNPALAKDLNEIAEKLVEEYLPRRGEIPAEIVKLYATRLTEKELQDALTFYKSPLGKKLLAESKIILQESIKRADAWGGKLREEVAGKIRAELKKRGHDI